MLIHRTHRTTTPGSKNTVRPVCSNNLSCTKSSLWTLGLKSWGWKDTFPYIIRNENQTDPDRAKSGYFGVSGPMPLEKSAEYQHLLESFIFTSKLSGYRMADLNAGVPVGTSILQTTTLKGKRVSAASAFLEPHLRRRNLHILSNTLVFQILFDQQQAIGVRFYRNWKSYTVYAKREIILSAGAINTPKLLLLSGIGPREELLRHGIPEVANLPVGENLHDHVGSLGMHFTVDLPSEVTPSSTVTKQTLKQYFQTGKGPLAEARVAATMFKSQSTLAPLSEGGSTTNHMRQDYESGYYESPDLMLLTYQHSPGSKELTAEQAEQRSNLRQNVWNRYYRPHKGRTQFTIMPVLLKPLSRGTVRLNSANPLDPPLVNPNYLAHPLDRDRLLEAMYEALRHVQSRPFRAFNTEMFHTIIPGCEDEAPFQVQDPVVLVGSATAEVQPESVAQVPETNLPQPQTSWPMNPVLSYTSSTTSLAPQQNGSTANKFVSSFLTKILFDSSKKEHTGSGGVGSFFGLRTRKQRSTWNNNNYNSDYERYWMQDSGKMGATTLNSRYQTNMIDGFSSVAVSTAADYVNVDENEEIETVWSNHKFRNRNGSYSLRPLHHHHNHHHHPHISSHPNIVTIGTRRTTTPRTTTTTTSTTTTTTTTTTTSTTTTMRPRTTRRSTTRRMSTTRRPPLTAAPYSYDLTLLPETAVVETATNVRRRPLMPVVIIDRNPLGGAGELLHTRYGTTSTSAPPVPPPPPPPPSFLPVIASPATILHSSITSPPPPPKLPTSAPPLSDSYLRCMARQLTAPMGDYVGTARMGGDDDAGRVVDSKFRVVGGIEGLRIADASVVPEIVSGGLAPVAMMIGERAADFIKQDLRRSASRK